MTEFRANQLSDLKRNERSRYTSIITAERTNIKKEYTTQLNALKERHALRLQAAERAQKELDRVAFDARQKHLDTMNNLNHRKEEMKRRNEVEKRATAIERNRISEMETKLRGKYSKRRCEQM